MNTECSNKLLKMIEEPYEGTCMILASDNPSLLLPTIYSRLQRISVDRYADSEIELARIAHGSRRRDGRRRGPQCTGQHGAGADARERQHRTRTLLPRFMELMRLAYQRNVAELKRWSADMAADGRDRAAAFCDYAASQVRENFMARLAGRDSSWFISPRRGRLRP